MHAHIHPSSARFTVRLSQGSVSTLVGQLRPMMVSSFRQSLYREPLDPRAGVTSPRHGIRTHVGEHYLAFVAHTGSCARPPSSHSLGFTLVLRVLAGCCASLLDEGPSQHYLCNLCVGAWSPTPPSSLGAIARYFPRDNGLTLQGRSSALGLFPCNANSTGSSSRGCRHSMTFRLPRSLDPPIAPTAVQITYLVPDRKPGKLPGAALPPRSLDGECRAARGSHPAFSDSWARHVRIILIHRNPRRTCPVKYPIPVVRKLGGPFKSCRVALRGLFLSLQKNAA